MVTLTPNNAARIAKKYGGIEPVSVGTTAQDRGLALGIYGPGGVGKTTLAATITNSELGSPALLLDARGNPHVIASYGDKIQVIQITRFGDLERIRQDILKDKEFPFKSVILDNVTEMWSIDLRDRYGPVADVDWTKHAATTADVLQLIRNWMDLSQVGPKLNVVFVFQETPEQRTIRNQNVSRSEIAANKALQSHVPTLINFLGRLYQESDVPPYRRLLDFRPVETVHQSKLQIDPDDPYAKQIPMEVYNPSLASILDTMRGQQPWPTAKHSKAGQ
jgi:hypothetical protein